MDWLLAYESTAVFTAATTSAAQLSNSFLLGSKPSTSSSMPPGKPPADDISNYAIYAKVPPIVECYRNYKRKQFKPNVKAYTNLKQMGFEEYEVMDALWVHSNNEVAAVSH